jgi:hypothetical protein
MTFDIQTIAVWAGILIGVYGALLSTALAVREWSKEKRRIHVKCDFGQMFPGGQFERAIDVVTIRAINVGHRDVEIVSAGWQYEDKTFEMPVQDVDGSTPIPGVITAGQRLSITARFDSLQANLDKHRQKHSSKSGFTRVFVRDSLDGYYYGKLSKIMLERKMGAKKWFF